MHDLCLHFLSCSFIFCKILLLDVNVSELSNMWRRCLPDIASLCQYADAPTPSFIFTRGLKKSIKVSESAPVSFEDITEHLEKNGMKFEIGHACLKTTCPRFTRPKFKLGKLNQLYINSTTGNSLCEIFDTYIHLHLVVGQLSASYV